MKLPLVQVYPTGPLSPDADRLPPGEVGVRVEVHGEAGPGIAGRWQMAPTGMTHISRHGIARVMLLGRHRFGSAKLFHEGGSLRLAVFNWWFTCRTP